MKFARLGGPLLLIKFENKEEADKVLLRGHRWFKELILHLDRWDPNVGCPQNGKRAKSVWVRVVGLPLHFWNQEVFRKIEDCCGGFVAVDEDTANFKELQWARLLVKSEGLEWSSSLQVVVGSFCYVFQLWWEVKLGLSEVVLVIRNEKGKEQEVKDDGEGDSRVGFKMEKVQTHREPAKVVESCKVGEGGCRKEVESSGTVSETVAEADGTEGGQRPVWGKSSCFGLGKKLPLGRQRESRWERGPAEEGQVFEVFKDLVELVRPMMEPSKGPMEVGQPNLENLKGVKACDGNICVWGEQGGELFGPQLGSLRPAFNLSVITDEALIKEASRYSNQFSCSLFSLGKRKISLSSTPSGRDGEGVAIAKVSDRGSGSKVVGGAVMGPLRMILADGKEVEVSDLAGKESRTSEEASEGVSERVSQEERVEEGKLCWHSSSMAKFSHYLGTSTEGFEGEILFLLKRTKKRKLQKEKLNGRKRKKLESSKFKRELRKLEWTVNYLGGGREEGEVQADLNEAPTTYLECKRGQ